MLSKQRFTEILGKNLKEARLKKGLTQDELAHKGGFYRTYVNLIETARRTPSTYSLHRLATVLKVKVTELYPSQE